MMYNCELLPGSILALIIAVEEYEQVHESMLTKTGECFSSELAALPPEIRTYAEGYKRGRSDG